MRAQAFLALAVATVALAGCSGSSGEPISYSGSGTTWAFHAGTSGDNWTWDLGDHGALAYGRDVARTYAFKDGTLQVHLTTRTGETSRDDYADLVLGNGQNGVPTFVLDAPTNWTEAGRSIRFTAAASTDPDQDPLLYSWSCLRDRDIVRQKPHSHGGFTGGVDFASPPAGAVTARQARITLPAPDHTYTGDLCDGLGQGNPLGHDATIEGTFARQGLYTITLLATDGKIPTTAGRWQVYVSPAGEKPNPVTHVRVNGTFVGGHDGSVQAGTGQLPTGSTGQTFDEKAQTFALPLSAQPVYINLTFDAGPQNAVTWILSRGTSTIATGGADAPLNTVLGTSLADGNYVFTVRLQTGAQVHFEGTIDAHLKMDPAALY